MQALRQAQADVDVPPPAHVASESNGALQQLAEEVGEGDDGEKAAESLQHEEDVINEDASDSEAEEGALVPVTLSSMLTMTLRLLNSMRKVRIWVIHVLFLISLILIMIFTPHTVNGTYH